MEITNRKAKFEYLIIDTYEAGIVLTGTEIKSIRAGKANLKDSYAIIRNNEVYLLNTHISEYKEGNIFNHDPRRTRKLLLHKREILKYSYKIVKDGYTLIPTKIYLKNGRCKVEIALAKGKKNFDKRETIKNRENDIKIRKAQKGDY